LVLGKRAFLVPIGEVDLDTDAVWKPGDGDIVRKNDYVDKLEKAQKGWPGQLKEVAKRIC
jgi:hypothetical protein